MLESWILSCRPEQGEKCQLGLSLQNVRHSLLGETQEESEASISQKDKMLPAINGWYLAFLHNKPHSQWDGNSAWAGSCNFWQLLLLLWHGSQLLILPCARQKSVLLLSLASMLSNADLDSELLWSELSGIRARQQGFCALMYSLLLTGMGKPGWRSKQGRDGHLLCSVLQIRCWAKASSPAALKVENTSCHCHSQKNKKRSSALARRPASPLPPGGKWFLC